MNLVATEIKEDDCIRKRSWHECYVQVTCVRGELMIGDIYDLKSGTLIVHDYLGSVDDEWFQVLTVEEFLSKI